MAVLGSSSAAAPLTQAHCLAWAHLRCAVLLHQPRLHVPSTQGPALIPAGRLGDPGEV